MRRDSITRQLAEHKPALAKQFGVTDLALFGSSARDTAGPNSDIDVLVAFDGPATSKRYFGVLFYLEDHLACSVDLVTNTAIREELRPHIEREAIHV